MSELGTPDRPWPIRMRNDLRVSEQSFRGQKTFVVGNPTNNEHFYLPEQQYALLKLFDGIKTPNQIRDQFQRMFSPARLEIREIEQQTIQLFEKGLVESTVAGMGNRLIAKEKRRVAKKRLESVLSIVSLRLRGIDPSRMLSTITPYLKWLFAWPVVSMNMLVFAITILWLLANLAEFRTRLPAAFDFFSGGNFFGFILVFSVVKVLHELGHGVLYTALGGKCRNLGVSLLVFVPTLYVDTTDSWRIDNKWHRAGIAAAGMYVESMLASLAVWVWWVTAPGLVHYTALHVLASCVLSSVAFNANPLVKSDGYFIFSDLFEIPNLASKATQRLRYHLRNYFFVEENEHEEFYDQSARRLLVVYGVLALFYRVILLSGIAWLILRFGTGYGAESLAFLAVLGFIGINLFAPLKSAWGFSKRHDLWVRARKTRLLAASAIAIVTIVGMATIPVPDRVVCDFVMEPEDAQVVRCPEAGVLTERFVEQGDWVSAGTPIARIRNIDLEIQLAGMIGELKGLQAREATLLAATQVTSDMWRERQDLQEKIRSKSQLLGELEERTKSLTIRAPRDGHVIGIWHEDPIAADPNKVGFHSGWGLSSDDSLRYIKKNEAICRIANRQKFQAKVFVPQDSVREISQGATVNLLPRTGMLSGAYGKVVGLSECNVEELPKSLSLRFGGGHESNNRHSARHGTDQDFHATDGTTETLYAASVKLTSETSERYFDSVGIAKVELTKKSLFSWFVHRISKSLRFDLRS